MRAGINTMMAAALTFALSGAEAQTAKKSARERLQEVTSDPQQYARVLAAGREASAPCAGCHGLDGNSSHPDTPNLAAQNPLYLLVQFHKLDIGLRQHDTMAPFVKMMTADDRFNIVVFYAAQKVRPPDPGGRSASLPGELIYNSQYCSYCHGPNALGTEKIPRLAGQQRDYIIHSLKVYRSRNLERVDPMMSAVVENLSDEDIANLADFLGGLYVAQ